MFGVGWVEPFAKPIKHHQHARRDVMGFAKNSTHPTKRGQHMLVGVPKEIKDNENRVGLIPSTVRELTHKGHRVLVETNAGVGAGLGDADYQAAGAEIVP